MPPRFHPHLVNDPFGDPAMFVDFLHERRALLFDLGDLSSLPPRMLLRISHVFVSHTHVDHFIGFDHLVRICLGREKRLHLYGPPGFVDQVEHRLASYTWNLVENYPTDFTVVAAELHPEGLAKSAEFHCLRRFMREGDRQWSISANLILEEDTLCIRAAFLDHRIPCLAFALEEGNHVNILKNRLDERGWPVGPWLNELKKRILAGGDEEEPFRIWWKEGGALREHFVPLVELKNYVVSIVPGQKITYVTDTAFTPGNAEKIVGLAKGSDYLFIETTFLDEERERAQEKCHLTARQAGDLARRAAVERIVPFHFSPKNKGKEDMLRRELEEAYRGKAKPE